MDVEPRETETVGREGDGLKHSVWMEYGTQDCLNDFEASTGLMPVTIAPG